MQQRITFAALIFLAGVACNGRIAESDSSEPGFEPAGDDEDRDDDGDDDPIAAPPPPGCDSPRTLPQLVACIAARMPVTGSDRYVPPSPAETAAFRGAVKQMLNGACEAIALDGLARTQRFRDVENERSYCVLSEMTEHEARGLGTVIVDRNAECELVQGAPHPFTDATTQTQALAIFRATRSRMFLMSGAYRDASVTASSCQRSYRTSDAAHETDHLFQATTEELAAFYRDDAWVLIEWHGMAESTCPGVNAYLTYGTGGLPPAASPLFTLRDAMRAAHPDWAIHVPGTSAQCSMGGGSNVQGRFLNHLDRANVCGVPASSPSGRLIHVEQQPGFRDAADWIAAVKQAFPASKRHRAKPLAPTGLTIIAVPGAVILGWTSSHGASSYTVEESSASRDPRPIVVEHPSTSVRIASAAGMSRCFAVTANSAIGRSPRSHEVCAITQ